MFKFQMIVHINFDNMSRGGALSGSCGEDGLCDMS